MDYIVKTHTAYSMEFITYCNNIRDSRYGKQYTFFDDVINLLSLSSQGVQTIRLEARYEVASRDDEEETTKTWLVRYHRKIENRSYRDDVHSTCDSPLTRCCTCGQ